MISIVIINLYFLANVEMVIESYNLVFNLIFLNIIRFHHWPPAFANAQEKNFEEITFNFRIYRR